MALEGSEPKEMAVILSPRWGWFPFWMRYPRLTPWGNFFRPSGPEEWYAGGVEAVSPGCEANPGFWAPKEVLTPAGVAASRIFAPLRGADS